MISMDSNSPLVTMVTMNSPLKPESFYAPARTHCSRIESMRSRRSFPSIEYHTYFSVESTLTWLLYWSIGKGFLFKVQRQLSLEKETLCYIACTVENFISDLLLSAHLISLKEYTPRFLSMGSSKLLSYHNRQLCLNGST